MKGIRLKETYLIIFIGLLWALSGIGYGQISSEGNGSGTQNAAINVTPDQVESVNCYVIKGIDSQADDSTKSVDESGEPCVNCQETPNQSINVNEPPVCGITASSKVCAGSTGNVAQVLYQSGAVYAWTLTNGNITKGQSTPRIEFTAGTAGTVILGVKVTRTYPSGTSTIVCECQSSIEIQPVSNNGCEIVLSSPTVCVGSANNVASVPSQPGATYYWQVIGGNITSGQYTNQIYWKAGTSAGTAIIKVTVGRAKGYESSVCTCANSKNVTIFSKPICTITAPLSVCEGSIAEALVPDQSGVTYNWSIANGEIMDGQNSPKIKFKALEAGNPLVLHVEVINSRTGCRCYV
jgi:PKD-like domain